MIKCSLQACPLLLFISWTAFHKFEIQLQTCCLIKKLSLSVILLGLVVVFHSKNTDMESILEMQLALNLLLTQNEDGHD